MSSVSVSNSILLVCFTFIASVILYNIRAAKKPFGCQSVPGPRLHFGTRVLMFLQVNFLHTVPEFTKFWCQHYGDTVGVWMNGGYTIVTCDAEFSQKILSGTESKNFIIRMGNKDGLKAIGMYKKGIIWNNDVSKWNLQRHIFQSGLSSDVRRKASIVARNITRQEIHRIKTSVRKDNTMPTVDLINVLRHITLAVVLDVAFGTKLDRERSEILIDCIVNYFKAWEFFLLKPRFIWPLFPYHVYRHQKAVLKLQEEIRNLSKDLNPQASPFLQNLYNNDLTTEEIHQCILEMILAGTDTSSVSLYYTIMLLTENRKIENQMLDSSNDLFIEAVLREGMRLMPVGPVIIRRALADCEISGTHIKAGTNIVIQLALQNRNPKWFNNPLSFDPQRFLQNENLIALSAPMGLGPKSCVGQHLAMVEMKPAISGLLAAFKFERINATKLFIDTKTKWDIAQQPIVNEIIIALPRKKIVLVGAHSVGKTTLANLIASRTNAVLISETARTVMKKMNVSPELLRKNPQKSLDFQASIIQHQFEKEGQIKHEFAILDRCSIDALVYAKTFCEQWEKLLDMPETCKCIENYKSDEYVIFLIEPQSTCWKDDGVRMMSKDYDDWKAFSERFKDIMNLYKIKFQVLEELDLNIRFMKVFHTLFDCN
ncbi:5459_t:CDS:1 [Diversispora eburnea]|uniref:5459_t:CDS:1 n=1 Tax=Diversispora eburnea TaxID=1213867 RepID=A0A9N8WHT1_9GLOM|nr:5459_t:CDS:1 [Diversispora eburnea]